MKKILYLIALAILPIALLKAEHGPRSLEGIWFSSHGYDELKIQPKSYGIKVKGITNNKRFERVGHRTYTNYSGVKIRFVGPNELIVTRKRNGVFRQKITKRRYFKTSGHRARNRNHSRYGDRWGDHGYHHDYRNDDYYHRDQRSDFRNDRNGSYRIEVRNAMEGTWKTQGLDKNKRVVIKASDSGIKAKFKNQDRWSFYAQENNSPNTFVDRKGNEYILRDNGKLVWRGQGQKTFTLVRL